MSDDIQVTQKVYSAKEAASLLGIQNSTVRKYAQLLEKSGYHINKNGQGHRGFFDKDIIVLRQIIELTKHPDMSIEQAINVVVSMDVSGDISKRDTTEIAETNYITKEEFEDYQRRQAESQLQMFEKLIERQDKFNQAFLDRYEQRVSQRDGDLMTAIRLIQESHEQAAITKQKKSFWSRLFGR